MQQNQTFLFEAPVPPMPPPTRRGAAGSPEDLERRARAMAEDPFALKAWLDGAAETLLTAGSRALLMPWEYDFENKRLISANRTVALQWQLREDPKAPISDDNPQHAVGVVKIHFLPITTSGTPIPDVTPAGERRRRRGSAAKGHHPRSREAFERNQASFTEQEARIIQWLESRKAEGGTAAEAVEALSISMSSASARFSELKDKGGIAETRLARLTPWGNKATVCVLPEFLEEANAKAEGGRR